MGRRWIGDSRDLHEREAMHIHFRLARGSGAKGTESSNIIEILEKENIELKSDLHLANNKIQSSEEYVCTLVSTGRLEWKIKGVKHKIGKKEDTFKLQ